MTTELDREKGKAISFSICNILNSRSGNILKRGPHHLIDIFEKKSKKMSDFYIRSLFLLALSKPLDALHLCSRG